MIINGKEFETDITPKKYEKAVEEFFGSHQRFLDLISEGQVQISWDSNVSKSRLRCTKECMKMPKSYNTEDVQEFFDIFGFFFEDIGVIGFKAEHASFLDEYFQRMVRAYNVVDGYNNFAVEKLFHDPLGFIPNRKGIIVSTSEGLFSFQFEDNFTL